MSRKIFVNLAVKDLNKSIDFFKGLGFILNPQFTDETAACLVISEHIFAMLLTHERFKKFIPNEICDTSKSTEALLALSCESREEVDQLVSKVLASGGQCPKDPLDYGQMYIRSVLDLDGHVWELFWMDPSMVQPIPN